MKMKMLVGFGILLLVSQHALAAVVEVNEGAEPVLMPCDYNGMIPEYNPLVIWTRSDLKPSLVHLRRDEEDDLKDQNQDYRHRTSMRPDFLDTGNFSLTLRKPRISDSGNYICRLGDGREEWRVTEVQLKVQDQQEEVEVKEGAESVILPCRTTPDLPEDATVEWTRSDPVFMFVHVFPNTSKHYKDQDEGYLCRVKMDKDLLRTGDLSLTLEFLRGSDSGSYICTVYRHQDILRHKVVLKQVKEGFPAWATALLVLLFVVLPVCGGVLFYFRHYFMSGYQVEVESGVESVLLPFTTTPELPGEAKVVWRDSRGRKVHVFKNGSDRPEEQHRFYRNRTKMNEDLLRTGDLSLTLRHPTAGDSGQFFCGVWRDRDILRQKTIQIEVKVQQVEVEEGAESVLLPFKTTPELLGDAEVEWKDSRDRTVHVFENGSDQPEEQDRFYRNRTKMNEDRLRTGDLSLTLRHPTVRDRGEFRCLVWKKRDILRLKRVQLKVKGTVQVQDPPEDIRTNSSSVDPSPLMADQSV
ncbi:polymeric immunoglobulin receptor-like isoform X2 [Kryptolebias marmoratus]|uniref:polymeric immunoglobulin receptor-like isoform X2 n=1 Tax=Kryptolebias marmoratus TaxID=37003 RepID=UPI0018AD0D6E|nr:polymeric immunoglobulin receptor-like isoform X2 [Kryptolebias marmoratus]